jgi:hypothetical protein
MHKFVYCIIGTFSSTYPAEYTRVEERVVHVCVRKQVRRRYFAVKVQFAISNG